MHPPVKSYNLVMIFCFSKILCRPSAHMYPHTPFPGDAIWKFSNLCLPWLCLYNKQNHRITEWWGLEGTSVGHL